MNGKSIKSAIAHFFSLDEFTIDFKLLSAIIFAAFCLICAEYFKSIYKIQDFFFLYFHRSVNLYELLPVKQDPDFQNLLVWSIDCVLSFLILPGLFIKLILKQKLSDYGITFHLKKNFLYLYGILFLGMIPLLFWASHQEAFIHKYPFFKISSKAEMPLFLKWEIIYIFQFIAIEFFFRGFLIHAFKHKFGYYSILIPLIPYCMIHFGKPIPETIGAIFAGLILGFLSLNTNSILLGILIHIGVALSMDFLALYRMGIFN